MPLRIHASPVALVLGILALATQPHLHADRNTPVESGSYGARAVGDLTGHSPGTVAPTVESPFGSGSVGARVRRASTTTGAKDAFRPTPPRLPLGRLLRNAEAARSGIPFSGSPVGATRSGWTTGTPPPAGLLL
ncbi:MAG: hypothetical protein WEG36_09295 [Gemmatimonadota bacterium]